MSALGSYGLNIPIQIKNSDIDNLVDITFCYHETRSYDSLSDAKFKKLPSSVLTLANRDEVVDGIDNYVEGMYNLQLPLSEFNKKGFYTVYIKPKEIKTRIMDVGSLTAFPNVRGIVLDSSEIENNSLVREKLLKNNELVGYRIIYLDDSGGRQDYYRIITSNNKCEPVVQAPSSSSDKSYTYRYEDSSSISFLTLTPSAAPIFKDNQSPYIGKVGQKILLVNTLFEPIMIDIEMTTHDADTISYMLEGSQLRDLDNGLVTTFNDKNEIYNQAEHFTLKDQYSGKPVYEVKENKKNSVDFSQTLDDKIG
jgi:hypothetical protein